MLVQVQWTCSSKLQNSLDQQLDAGRARTATTEHSYNDLFKLSSPTKFVQQHLGRKWKKKRKHRIVWSTAAARADGWLMMIWHSSPQQTVAAPKENSCRNGSQQLDVFSILQVDKQRRLESGIDVNDQSVLSDIYVNAQSVLQTLRNECLAY